MKFCRNCGRELSLLRRADAEYCDQLCKVQAYRNDHVAQAKRILELVREPELALVGSICPVGETWQERVAYVERSEKIAVGTYGMAVITASARPVSAGVCRWCLALIDSGWSGKPSPYAGLSERYGSMKLLLGDPCHSCLGRIKRTLKISRSAASKSSSANGTRGPSTTRSGTTSEMTASAAGPNPHQGCETCQNWLRKPLPPSGIPPHRRVPA